ALVEKLARAVEHQAIDAIAGHHDASFRLCGNDDGKTVQRDILCQRFCLAEREVKEARTDFIDFQIGDSVPPRAHSLGSATVDQGHDGAWVRLGLKHCGPNLSSTPIVAGSMPPNGLRKVESRRRSSRE